MRRPASDRLQGILSGWIVSGAIAMRPKKKSRCCCGAELDRLQKVSGMRLKRKHAPPCPRMYMVILVSQRREFQPLCFIGTCRKSSIFPLRVDGWTPNWRVSDLRTRVPISLQRTTRCARSALCVGSPRPDAINGGAARRLHDLRAKRKIRTVRAEAGPFRLRPALPTHHHSRLSSPFLYFSCFSPFWLDFSKCSSRELLYARQGPA